jgi:hypothetical protein
MADSINIPNADDLSVSIIERATVRSLLGIFGPAGSRARNTILSFLRLVDKCAHEYRAGSERLVEFHLSASPPLITYFRVQGHFENCLHSLHRSLLFVRALKRLGIRGPNGEQILPEFRSLSVMSRDSIARVKDMRDAMEHMDERVWKEAFPLGRHLGLHVSVEGLQLEGGYISYVEIHSWIKQLQSIAQSLLSGPDLMAIDPTS